MSRKTPKWDSMWEMAQAIANGKARGLPYREDVVSDAYLAVAKGASQWSQVHNAVRNSLRQEWSRERRFKSLQIADSLMRQEPPERARVDVWEALGVLDERQRTVVILTFWEGLKQAEIAETLGIGQQHVSTILAGAIHDLKIFFSTACVKQGGQLPYYCEGENAIR